MKRVTLTVMLVLFALPLVARPARRSMPRPARVAELQSWKLDSPKALARKLLSQETTKGVGSDAIIINRSARALVIPAAGSAAGANGTFFRTDLTIANWNDEAQIIAVFWVPNGNPDGFDGVGVIVPAGPPSTVEDFVGTILEKTGVGSLILIPVVGQGEVELDEDAAIDAFSRIWTPQPNSTGTVSQPFPGVEPDFMTGEYEAMILGLRQDEGYRTNYGILNLSDVPLPFVVTVFPEENPGAWVETNVTLQPMSMIQTSIPAGAHGLLTLAVNVDADIDGDDFTWVTWASSTDNKTGDGWVSIGANPWSDDDLDTAP